MIGSHRITIANMKLKYDFTLHRNITIIKGDSATGKTTLVEMVREYYDNGKNSGITLNCDKECRVIGGRDWSILLNATHDSIVFIDEDNDFLPTDAFARTVRESDNYYVIVTREGLPNLPYSVTEIYGIRESGKYGSLRQTYNEMYRIYGDTNSEKGVQPDTIIVEDSDAGYEFFSKVIGIKVVSAEGKSNIFSTLLKYQEGRRFIIADGAAFGAEMDRVMKEIRREQNVQLFLPESFEWLILRSGVIGSNYVRDVLEDPADYIESRKYFSWERFFTALLIGQTKDTYLHYSKKKLNSAYLNKNISNRIVAQISLFTDRR